MSGAGPFKLLQVCSSAIRCHICLPPSLQSLLRHHALHLLCHGIDILPPARCGLQGIYHRDIKLENLLVDKVLPKDPTALQQFIQAQQPCLKICDFGWSKVGQGAKRAQACAPSCAASLGQVVEACFPASLYVGQGPGASACARLRHVSPARWPSLAASFASMPACLKLGACNYTRTATPCSHACAAPMGGLMRPAIPAAGIG
jgi:serine/threonine protein kinase